MYELTARTGNCLKNADIKTFGLSKRAINTLAFDNTYTVGDLIKWKSKELLKIPNLGKTVLKEIKTFLSQHGLKLSDEIDKKIF